MPTVIVDHHLKDFDSWFKTFMENPPPEFGQWRVARGTDDTNRVHVIGLIDESDVDAVKQHLGSEQMKKVFSQVNANSNRPVEFIWLEDVTPG